MEREERHARIVEFLNSLKNTEGNPAFKLKTYKKLRDRGVLEKTLDYQEVCEMTPLICEAFGIMSGSAGDIDFYRLFQSYLLDKDKREQINQII
ncbi:hypothetical protein [Fluviicola chungangensis]|uniref:Uncharacterized protein n=1 Tax=Fluviicola chungangensis TaxID=2597671 RepID=A0A556MR60_9FLAO|nr:hypothetical protein [Fluviicola chungangensis]TSJ42259.1 hypothetical protein FO442_10850 [Fluviicola chungangensis]